MGRPVIVSELHGLSRRGGAVQARVTFGGPGVTAQGREAIDLLVALELIEALRQTSRLGAHWTVIANRAWLPPPGALAAGSPPSANTIELELRRRAPEVYPYLLDAARPRRPRRRRPRRQRRPARRPGRPSGLPDPG
jgi:Pyruvate/2-oxoacid:ferredoxin oxidoreductase gamma subunit